MINSRKVSDLDPIARAVCEKHMALCKAVGLTILITSTYRDYEQQEALYAQGRTTPGNKVTNARAGQSFHNFRVAWDSVPIINGKCDWNASGKPFKLMVDLGRQAGAECGADWKKFKDYPHFQFVPKGLSIKDAKTRFDTNRTIY